MKMRTRKRIAAALLLVPNLALGGYAVWSVVAAIWMKVGPITTAEKWQTASLILIAGGLTLALTSLVSWAMAVIFEEEDGSR